MGGRGSASSPPPEIEGLGANRSGSTPATPMRRAPLPLSIFSFSQMQFGGSLALPSSGSAPHSERNSPHDEHFVDHASGVGQPVRLAPVHADARLSRRGRADHRGGGRLFPDRRR